MQKFTPEYPAFHAAGKNGLVTVENEFVRWVHDLSKGGELVGAYVKNGSNKNLLNAPQYSALSPYVPGGWRQYHEYRTDAAKASAFHCSERDGVVTLDFRSAFTDAAGKRLAGASVRHQVTYAPCGAAEHTLTIKVTKALADLGQIRIGTLFADNRMDRLAVRPCSLASWAVELQNPCQWIALEHGRYRSDLPAYRSRFLPLSVLLMQSGVEGIEMALGDDLGAWDFLGTDVPGLQQGSVYESLGLTSYEVVFAPLESPRTGHVLQAGTYRFTYRLTLPYVRKNIVPLALGKALLGPDFKTHWPDRKKLDSLRRDGFSILRLHNDGDCAKNGVFWRDGAYPPYPADEMAKMDRCLADAADAGLSVVPYFSCKEYHPDAPGFEADAEKFARVVVPNEKFLVNFFGTSLFGMQMCLESGWFDRRKRSIRTPLEKHAFNGLYYDWCMGLECVNPAHNGGRRHWDNDRLLALLEWSRELAGRDGKLYLHLTNVPSLALENLGDLILTEESEYAVIRPEMFTPHVHFLNIAPRSICPMLIGKLATDENYAALALCALLHHATICSDHPAVLGVYRKYLAKFDAVSAYTRHAAPGEGHTFTDDPAVGMALYWDPSGALAVFANLSTEKRQVKWRADADGGQSASGRLTLPPLSLAFRKISW